MLQKRKDFISGLFFLLFAVLLYAGSYSIVVTKADAMGPKFFPRTVAVFMAVLAVFQMISGWKSSLGEEQNQGINIRSVITIVILFLYALLVEKLGFIIMTALYLFIQILLLLPSQKIRSARNVIFTFLLSVLIPLLIYHLFYHAFSIFLPTGILH